MNEAARALSGAHLRKEVHLATVSGVASTKKELVRWFDRATDVDVITTKSFQVTVNPGNREPVICEVGEGDFGNSVGLRNPGLGVALEDISQLRKEGLSKILNVSVSASSPDDFIRLIKAFDDLADTIELNFSCPHAASGYGASIGCDLGIASDYVRAIKAACPVMHAALLVKLTPNVDDIASIASAVIEAGADGIVAINTVGPRLYTIEGTDIPILNNKLGGKGGASGAWVNEEALKCVSEIRKAIGDGPIIIGMGGVSSGHDAARMVEAGADAVGLGSVFGRVRQQDWPAFIKCVKDEAACELGGQEASSHSKAYWVPGRRMEYREHRVVSAVRHTEEMLLLELDGELDCKAGQFAFLFVPGLGEKPFSVAHGKPLTFLIRRRGEFTKHLFDLKPGDVVYTRGLYGAALECPGSKRALLVAGGSGVAVVPSLCRSLEGRAERIDILVGTSASSTTGCDGKALFEDYLNEHAASYTVIADDGVPGRVLSSIPEALGDAKDVKLYLVGPEVFMGKAAEKALEAGLSRDDIYISLERMTLCGVGLCGECVCGDRLTCQWGTFQSYAYIMDEAPELLKGGH